jgi:hypothetical protein
MHGDVGRDVGVVLEVWHSSLLAWHAYRAGNSPSKGIGFRPRVGKCGHGTAACWHDKHMRAAVSLASDALTRFGPAAGFTADNSRGQCGALGVNVQTGSCFGGTRRYNVAAADLSCAGWCPRWCFCGHDGSVALAKLCLQRLLAADIHTDRRPGVLSGQVRHFALIDLVTM